MENKLNSPLHAGICQLNCTKTGGDGDKGEVDRFRTCGDGDRGEVNR